MRNYLKFFAREISRDVVAVVAVVGIAVFALAFTEPSVGPTGGTVNAPINVSGVAQTKAGNFTSLGTITGNTVNAVPSLCISGSCITSWGAAGDQGLQRQVFGTCSFGSSIRVINADGTVACEIDDVGAGGITGSGSIEQITFWTGASSVGSASGLVWDNTNSRFGIGTASIEPSSVLTVSGNVFIRNGALEVAEGGIKLISTGPIGRRISFYDGISPSPRGLIMFDGGFKFINQVTGRSLDFLNDGNLYLLGGAHFEATGNIIARNGRFQSKTRPNYYLELQADANMVLYDGGVATWSAQTGWLSDARFKKDIQPIGKTLDKIKGLSAVKFIMTNDELNTPQIGFIAQEVEQVFPEVVYTDKNTGYKLLKYERLSAVLLEAVKELDERMQSQQQEIGSLKARLEALESR